MKCCQSAKFKKVVTALLLMTGVFLAASSNANALTISYQTGWSNPLGTDTTGPPSGSIWSHNLFLPKFNTSLGTLTSVSFTSIATVNSYFTLKNNNSTTIGPGALQNSVDALITTSYVDATLPSTDVISLVAAGANWGRVRFPYATNLNKVTGGTGLAAGATFDSRLTTGGTYNPSGGKEIISSTDGMSFSTGLSLYTGLGSMLIPVIATGTYTYTGPDNTAIANVKDVGYWIGVTYDYTEAPPVPEPSTFILLGAGLIGVVAIRRRQKK